MKDAIVLWFTGLSGSGKSTIARGLERELISKGKSVLILDGDEVRKTLHTHLGFTPEDIKKNNELIAELCITNRNKYDVICVPIISPFIESRMNAKRMIGRKFREVYIKSTVDTVISRDRKGLYKKALKGEIDNFIGISKSVPYEEPINADIVIDTNASDAASCTKMLHEFVAAMENNIHG